MNANGAISTFLMQFAYGFPLLIAYGIGLFLGIKLRARSSKASTIVVMTMLGLMTLFVLSGIVRAAISTMGREALGPQMMAAHQLWSLCYSGLQGVGIIALIAACFQTEPEHQVFEE